MCKREYLFLGGYNDLFQNLIGCASEHSRLKALSSLSKLYPPDLCLSCILVFMMGEMCFIFFLGHVFFSFKIR